MDGALVRRIIDHARGLEERVLVSCEILDRWYTDRFDPSCTTETGRRATPPLTWSPLPKVSGLRTMGTV